MEIRDITNTSFPGSIQHHGTQVPSTSDAAVAATPGAITADGNEYGGARPQTPEDVTSASEDLSPKEGNVPCPSGPLPQQAHKSEGYREDAKAIPGGPIVAKPEQFKTSYRNHQGQVESRLPVRAGDNGVARGPAIANPQH